MNTALSIRAQFEATMLSKEKSVDRHNIAGGWAGCYRDEQTESAWQDWHKRATGRKFDYANDRY